MQRGNGLKPITRRELFSELYKDTMKNFFGAYKELKKSEKKVTTLTCEEAGLRLGRRAKKNLKKMFGDV
jgi:hypothetical protein